MLVRINKLASIIIFFLKQVLDLKIIKNGIFLVSKEQFDLCTLKNAMVMPWQRQYPILKHLKF